MILTYHTLDVFTDRVFGGNPLAVFPDATGLDDDTMLRIARELNLSETVFVLPNDERTVLGDVGDARVRSNRTRSAPAGSAGNTEIAPADPAPSTRPRIRQGVLVSKKAHSLSTSERGQFKRNARQLRHQERGRWGLAGDR